jgi:hypothetical protein
MAVHASAAPGNTFVPTAAAKWRTPGAEARPTEPDASPSAHASQTRKVRDIPARSLLCLLRHASNRQEVWDLGKEVIGMLKAQPPPRADGVAGAAFLIYYGEVNQDSDGPVEFCWPVPQDLAGQLAASFPGLTLRTEPAHQEAYIHLPPDPLTAAQEQLLSDSFTAWTAEQQRQPSDLPLRVTLLTTTAPVTDAGRRGGSDFALPLRDRAGAA